MEIVTNDLAAGDRAVGKAVDAQFRRLWVTAKSAFGPNWPDQVGRAGPLCPDSSDVDLFRYR